MREFLMRLVAGRHPYWLSDDAAKQFESLHSVAGCGAVIALVDAVKRVNADQATFELDGYTVTVSRRED